MSLPTPPPSNNDDAGLDAAPRSLSQTQSTPPSNSGYVTDPNFLDANAGPQTEFNPNSDPNTNIGAEWQGVAEPATEPGFGAASDDGTTPGILDAGAAPPGSSAVNASGFIQARPNVLNQYASYTYSLSWYLLTGEQYNSLASRAPNVNDWLLLMQSGGIGPDQDRSVYFPVDYYLDNLQIQSMLATGGQGTAAAHNVTALEFTVTEPNGITLINALSDAVKELYTENEQNETNAATGNKSRLNASLAIHCMVIHFYGYDDAGNPINTGAYGAQDSNGIAKAVIEKIYPFHIQKLEFRLANKQIEYNIKGIVRQYDLHASAKRGSIPANFELVGRTVGDILSGNGSTGTKVQLDDGRKSTPAVQTPPPSTGTTVADLPVREQAAIAAGTDYNLVNEDGMAFGGGGLTGA
jgi:hypothetical protein